MHRTVGGILIVLTLAAPTGGGEVTAADAQGEALLGCPRSLPP
jgi:hypothetical protein